ncbi:MAG: hypothetical protein DI570_27700, partial [Phenylobacterium zucineum]
ARSDQRGYRLSALPPEGYQGRIPRWPLPARAGASEEETKRIAARERAMWRWAWRTPQAWGWAQPQESWRIPTVAMWVRTFVICESDAATAADKNSLHRFAEQVGFTDAGLRLMGWKVSAPVVDDEDEEAAAEPQQGEEDDPPQRRLRAVT